MIGSYWKSANFGDSKLDGFFSGSALTVEEKIDGSQFSFGIIDNQLYCRSRNKVLELSNPEKMFAPAVEHVVSIQDRLPEGVIFRGEAVTSKRHNALEYSRIPNGSIVVFNADDTNNMSTLFIDEIKEMVELLGMEAVETLDFIEIPSDIVKIKTRLEEFLTRESMLGGVQMEGVVVKRLQSPLYFYDKPLFCKLVRQSFKELNKLAWSGANPKSGDVLQLAVDAVCTEARFNKTVQHLKEQGDWDGSAKDIEPLMKLLQRDIEEEDSEYLKEKLWKWALPQIKRMAGARIPQWYKDKLMKDYINGN